MYLQDDGLQCDDCTNRAESGLLNLRERALFGQTTPSLTHPPLHMPQVTAEAKFSDLGADSLDTVEIMMALEEKFEITLEEEGAEKIATVQDAADLIAGQIDN